MHVRGPNSSGATLEGMAPALPVTDGVCIGTLVHADPTDGLWVVFPSPESWDPIPARSTVPLTPDAAGKEVVLAFEQGDPHRPIILGVLQTQPVRTEEAAEAPTVIGQLPEGADRRVRKDDNDGSTVVIDAERELVLQCGKSSITLRANGEVYVKGLKIVSRARQTHKIKGGNVLIN